MRQQQVAPNATDWVNLLPTTPPKCDGIDDPYQCPYCGRPTGPDARRCPHCQGGLYVRVARSAGAGALQLSLLLLGLNLAVGLLALAAPILALAVQQNPDRLALGALQTAFGLGCSWAITALSAPVAWLVLRSCWCAPGCADVLLDLRERWRLAYAALLALLADLLVGSICSSPATWVGATR
jgi:hypothetical protein